MGSTITDTLSPVTYILADIQPLSEMSVIGEPALHALLVVTAGEAALSRAGANDMTAASIKHVLRSGGCFLLAADQTWTLESRAPLSGFILLFAGVRLGGMRQPQRQVWREEAALPDTGPIYHHHRQSEMLDIASELYSTRGDRETLTQMVRQRTFLQLLEIVWEALDLNQADGRTDDSTTTTLPPIQRTVRYMQDNYAEDLSREKLAALAEMSPAHYSHAFRKETGQSPMDVLTRIRIEAAKQLMVSKDWPLRKIAQNVGFQSEFYFSSRFKQVSGLAPSAYIKRDRTHKVARSHMDVPHVRPAPSGDQERIVGLFLEDPLIALGIKPLLQYAHSGYYQRYLSPYLLDVAQLDVARLDFEALRAARPEQIILGFSNFAASGRYERFAEIAPTTIFQQAEQDWRQSLRMLGAQLGREQEAESALARYESLAQRARSRLMKKIGGATVALLRFHFKLGMCLYGASSRYSGSVLYEDLALKMPAWLHHASGEGRESVIPISPEILARLQVDHLLLVIDDSQQALAQQVMTSALWQQLDVVIRGQVYELPTDVWMTFGILAHEHKIRQVLHALD